MRDRDRESRRETERAGERVRAGEEGGGREGEREILYPYTIQFLLAFLPSFPQIDIEHLLHYSSRLLPLGIESWADKTTQTKCFIIQSN